MKKIIQILIMSLLTIEGYSKCNLSGLYFWPEGQTINENSIFIIDGYSTSQKIINGLGKKYKVYLKSKEQIVKLNVQEKFEGQYNLTQAILVPEINLMFGVTYELIIENLTNNENLVSRYNYSTSDYEKVKWTVTFGIDKVKPLWTNEPKYTKDNFQIFGCGPEVNVIFSFNSKENSEILIQTKVKNISTGKESIYCLKPKNNIIAVGHNMCSGAFSLENSEFFEVEFRLIDASGNSSDWTEKKIKFKRPRLKNLN